ncbi:MAG: Ig-like domain-containing protein [Sporocytophaga sp.]|nr:Ig-like domain-containing protein [Sporocytophaga sp.]
MVAPGGAQAAVSLCEGGSLGIGPHPYDVESGWSWTGPGNFTSSAREISFTDIKPAQSGTYNVTFTDANNCNNSLSIPLTVHAKPAITITSPLDNSVITANPADIDIEVSVTGNNISNMQFLNGTTLLGQDAAAPYSFSWNNVANGSYSILVRATDANNCNNSESVSFTVNNVITSLEEGEYGDKSICYPNPFHHQFTIRPGAELEFAIMDVMGNVKEQGIARSQIQVGESLVPGIYFLKVNVNSKENMIKIIKE